MKRMKFIEKEKWKLPDKDILDNIETAFKSAFYMHFRYLYNNKKKYKLSNAFIIAIFLFIRNFAYSWMFRYNNNWDFNVPYGWIWYNSKNFKKKIDYLKSKELAEHLEKTQIENNDFEDFFKINKPQKDDFIFLDPPYDSEFSTYDKNVFNREDQKRLANYLIKKCEAKWMMIIKNTDFIFELYNNKGLNIKTFDKKYLVSFMNRNDKDVKHLLITNY
jgi:DNA adenine methylase